LATPKPKIRDPRVEKEGLKFNALGRENDDLVIFEMRVLRLAF
jgi:hypothetical protein